MIAYVHNKKKWKWSKHDVFKNSLGDCVGFGTADYRGRPWRRLPEELPAGAVLPHGSVDGICSLPLKDH